jgi:hypothetical protein
MSLFEECLNIVAPVNFKMLSKKEQEEKREEELEAINNQVINALELAIEHSSINLLSIQKNDKAGAIEAILDNIIQETRRVLDI